MTRVLLALLLVLGSIFAVFRWDHRGECQIVSEYRRCTLLDGHIGVSQGDHCIRLDAPLCRSDGGAP